MAFLEALAHARRACVVDAANRRLVVAAERLPQVLAVHPHARLEPAIEPPASRARTWERDAAIAELVRGRLCLTGPVTAAAMAGSMGVTVGEIDTALLALESEGVVLRGHFTPQQSRTDQSVEWCDRALLARIHRYTVNRLRAEIEPVNPADFMRFLLKWQHVDPSDRLTGLDGLRETLTLLDGFELAGAAWERAVLPSRVDGYEPSLLDLLCLTGEVAWARLSPRPAELTEPPRLTPATPVALFLREHNEAWQSLRRFPDGSLNNNGDELPLNARKVLDCLRSRGAMFFNDLRATIGIDADETRSAIGALVASGLAASDGFSGLRALLVNVPGRAVVRDRRATFAGRWSTIPAPPADAGRNAAIEASAWSLLARYGVVFRRLLTRENVTASWGELTRVYRRLEARGEIRGGHFVSGMSGEQFAMARAIERLREVRRSAADGRVLVVGTADPLNLAGIVTSGDRIRAATRNRIAYIDGVPVAVLEGGEVRSLVALDSSRMNEVTVALRARRPVFHAA